MAKKRKHPEHLKVAHKRKLSVGETVENGSYFSKIVNKAAIIQRFTGKTRMLQLVLIVMCALLVNINTLSNKFVYDDIFQVVNNSWITNFTYLPNIFTHNAIHTDLADINTSNYYRPMMNVIYMICYYVFAGLKPWGFHLINILFHIGATLLVYFVITLILSKENVSSRNSFFSIPLISALVFAVHPIHSEVVAWVACIPELSFTFFCLFTMYFHMKSLQNYDRNHFWSLALFTAALFCKETAVTLLPLLVLYDYLYRTEKTDIRYYFKRFALFALVTGIYSIIRLYALGRVAPLSKHPELNTYEVIINIIPLFSRYLEKLVIPVKLNAFYLLHPVHAVTDPEWIFSFLIVTVFAALGYILFKKSKSAFLGVMIITVPLLPVMYIRGLGENTFTERYLYFPSIGFALIIGLFFNYILIKFERSRKLIYAISVSVLMLYSIGTINRNMVWNNQLNLWTDTANKSPDSDFAHYNLGHVYYDKGDLDTAINEYREAITINPVNVDALYNLGLTLYDKGLVDAAIEEYQEVIAINPNYFPAHNNLGTSLAGKGQLDAAIEEFREALRLNPNSTTLNNLKIALAQKRMRESASK